jgi:hypothetical protein
MEFVRKPADSVRKSLVQKVGINDADYVTTYKVEGREVTCPFYRKWRNMLKRCYSRAYLDKRPTYEGCRVCLIWLRFSNFRDWMITQDWQGKDLDKDLLIRGNKIYSPSRCVFINSSTNKAIAESRSSKNKRGLLAGVRLNKNGGKYSSMVRKGIPSKNHYLGSYLTEKEAHNIWRLEKANNFRCLANQESDNKVKNALCEMARDLEVLV